MTILRVLLDQSNSLFVASLQIKLEFLGTVFVLGGIVMPMNRDSLAVSIFLPADITRPRDLRF